MLKKRLKIIWDGIGYKTEFDVGRKWIPVGNGDIDVLEMRFKDKTLEVRQLRMFSTTELQHMKLAVERLEDKS